MMEPETLYAWIGEDEHGSGEVGLKQHLMPAGLVPLVALDRSKIDRPDVRAALTAQAVRYGVTIRLVAFTRSGADPALVTLNPKH